MGTRACGFAMTIIDEEEAKQTQEALIAMSQLEHEVGDFLGLNQNKQDCVMQGIELRIKEKFRAWDFALLFTASKSI